jgi:hypothetical protein
MVFSTQPCGSLADREKQPANIGECTTDKNLTEGDKCCYISAKIVNVTASACWLLPKGVNETAVEAQAKALGSEATYSCASSYVTLSLVFGLIVALIF